MADLDPHTAATLCALLEPLLLLELGASVTCHDVSPSGFRWDLEARDAAGVVLRKISHVRAVSQSVVQAEAEVCDDIWKTMEAELHALGVVDHQVLFGVRALPPEWSRRRELARELATRVRTHVDDGTPILEDVMACVRDGRHPFEDAVTAAFDSVDVVPTPGIGPARVTFATSDQLMVFEAPLADVLLPVVARKQARHGVHAESLTLVVQIFDRGWTAADVMAVQQALEPRHRGFISAYVFRCPAHGPARIGRLY